MAALQRRGSRWLIVLFVAVPVIAILLAIVVPTLLRR